MLEKIFGKKSTGVVYIVCAGILFLALAGAAVDFAAAYPDASLYALFAQALLTLVSLLSISAPLIIQKRFRYYIPPFIEISLCVYAVLLLFLSRMSVPASVLTSFLPATGGFILSMLLFAVAHSALSRAAQEKGRRASPLTACVLTFAAALVLLLLLTALFALASFIAGRPQSSLRNFLYQCAFYLFGSVLFCLTGYFSVRSHDERFRIHSFKNTEKSIELAAERQNKTMFTVVKNLSEDDTDYKKVFQRAKAQYYLIRIIYLAAYAAYIVHAYTVFSGYGGWGYAIIVFHLSSFLFTSVVYVYEYLLYRKRTVNQRLRKLKIAKTIARSYTLFLILLAIYTAGLALNRLSVFLSVGLLIFNLSLLFYNLFGKPKYYPSAKSLKEKRLLRGAQEAESAEDTAPAQESDAPADGAEKPLAAEDTAPAEGGNGVAEKGGSAAK